MSGAGLVDERKQLACLDSRKSDRVKLMLSDRIVERGLGVPQGDSSCQFEQQIRSDLESRHPEGGGADRRVEPLSGESPEGEKNARVRAGQMVRGAALEARGCRDPCGCAVSAQ